MTPCWHWQTAPPGQVDHHAFAAALADLCTDLAQQIVRDGEGATKFITIRVTGAASDSDARVAAKAVANSPLVKTAFYGGDANWGRILAAAAIPGPASTRRRPICGLRRALETRPPVPNGFSWCKTAGPSPTRKKQRRRSLAGRKSLLRGSGPRRVARHCLDVRPQPRVCGYQRTLPDVTDFPVGATCGRPRLTV